MPEEKSDINTKQEKNLIGDIPSSGNENVCKARVTHETHGICPSVSNTIMPNIPVRGDQVVVKIPVVLSEPTITIPVIAHIKLETKAVEIKRIRKNVFLTQCHLIPGSVTKAFREFPATGVLVIEGFVRKNIEYATKECRNHGVISGRINHTTVKVPFSCTTTVTFDISPVFIQNIEPIEIETLSNKHKGCNDCAENIQGSNTCERNFSQAEFFNERVFCELVSATIFESDINEDPESIDCTNPLEMTFDEITEKMVVKITLKLLQKQQVRITSEDDGHD